MEAGGMIARARSSQTRNAENRLLISKVLEGYPIGQFRWMFVDFTLL